MFIMNADAESCVISEYDISVISDHNKVISLLF